MPFPSISDDGSVLELDLHGATVDEALRLARRALKEAGRRGRSSVRLIHGRSTDTSDPFVATIKRALYDELERGAYGDLVTGVIRMDGAMLLSLPVGGRVNPARISMLDIQ